MTIRCFVQTILHRLVSGNLCASASKDEWREDKKCLGGLMPEGRGSVPEGRSDRSLARSAWNSPTPKEQSRRARYDQSQTLSQGYFASRGAPCFLRKANLSNHRIGAHTGANQTVPYGTALLRCAVQALRARLRSDRPFGTKPLRRGNESSQTFLNLVPFTADPFGPSWQGRYGSQG